MKQQFVVTHTIRQTEIPALLRRLGYKYTVKIFNPGRQKKCFSLYFRKNDVVY
jgi:hypothetical protein